MRDADGHIVLTARVTNIWQDEQMIVILNSKWQMSLNTFNYKTSNSHYLSMVVLVKLFFDSLILIILVLRVQQMRLAVRKKNISCGIMVCSRMALNDGSGRIVSYSSLLSGIGSFKQSFKLLV